MEWCLDAGVHSTTFDQTLEWLTKVGNLKTSLLPAALSGEVRVFFPSPSPTHGLPKLLHLHPCLPNELIITLLCCDNLFKRLHTYLIILPPLLPRYYDTKLEHSVLDKLSQTGYTRNGREGVSRLYTTIVLFVKGIAGYIFHSWLALSCTTYLTCTTNLYLLICFIHLYHPCPYRAEECKHCATRSKPRQTQNRFNSFTDHATSVTPTLYRHSVATP